MFRFLLHFFSLHVFMYVHICVYVHAWCTCELGQRDRGTLPFCCAEPSCTISLTVVK